MATKGMTREQIEKYLQVKCTVFLDTRDFPQEITHMDAEYVWTYENDKPVRHNWSSITKIVSWPIPKKFTASHINHYIQVKTKTSIHYSFDYNSIDAVWYPIVGFSNGCPHIRVCLRGRPQEIHFHCIEREDILAYCPVDPITIDDPETPIKDRTIRPAGEHVGTIQAITPSNRNIILPQVHAGTWVTYPFSGGWKQVDSVNKSAVFIGVGKRGIPWGELLSVCEVDPTLREVGLDGKVYGPRPLKISKAPKIKTDTWVFTTPVSGVYSLTVDGKEIYRGGAPKGVDINWKLVDESSVLGVRPSSADRINPCSEIQITTWQMPCTDPSYFSQPRLNDKKEKIMLNTIEEIKNANIDTDILEKAAQETKRINDDELMNKVRERQGDILRSLAELQAHKKRIDGQIAEAQDKLAALGYPPKNSK